LARLASGWPHAHKSPDDRPWRGLVRRAIYPDGLLLEFLQATCDAAADTAGWDRAALDQPPGGHRG
jgi:hypothetical protein